MSIDYRGVPLPLRKSGCIETFAAGWANPSLSRAQEKSAPEATRGKRIVESAGGKVGQGHKRNPCRKRGRKAYPLLIEMLRETADILAVLVWQCSRSLEPDIIVVGGGLSSLMARWFDRIASQSPFWSVQCAPQRDSFR